MAKASFNGVVIAQSDDVEITDGNPYFPPESCVTDYFSESKKTTECSWKGTAKYYDITVNGETAEAAAWYYPEPKPEAEHLKGRIAFWGKVEVEK